MVEFEKPLTQREGEPGNTVPPSGVSLSCSREVSSVGRETIRLLLKSHGINPSENRIFLSASDDLDSLNRP